MWSYIIPIGKLAKCVTLFYRYFRFETELYLLIPGIIFITICVVLKGHLAARKIQIATPSIDQMSREISYSFLTIAIFSLWGVVSYVAYLHGFNTLYFIIAEHGWFYFGMSLSAMIVVHDTYFYWVHRLMHQPRLFSIIHYIHHRSKSPSPWAAYSFDPAEAFVQGAFVTIFTVIMPIHLLVGILFVVHMLIRNAIGHSGYEVFPKWSVKSPWLNWCLTVTHHDLHHRYARYNYGLYFSWWDRLMGTEHPRYQEWVTRENDIETSWAGKERGSEARY